MRWTLIRWFMIRALVCAVGVFGVAAQASERSRVHTTRLCIDQRVASTCLDRARLFSRLWPQASVGAQGLRLADGQIVELVELRAVRTDGERQFAIAVFERWSPDPQGRRPDCHACVPEMDLIVLREQQGRWSVLARSSALQGPGSWGELSVKDLRIEHLGGERFLIGFASGYTGQGVTETALSWYGNLTSSGAASPRLVDLGTISTGRHVCGAGHLEESLEAKVVTIYQGAGLPAFLRIENSRFCHDDKPPLSHPPVLHPIDPTTMKIRP